MQKMDDIKVGFIGTGSVATVHAEAVQALPGARTAKIFDLDFARSKSFAARFGGTAVAELTDLLQGVDCIVVASPNNTHAKYAIQAALASLPVLCEKPMANSVEEAEAMLSIANLTGIYHAVGFNYRFLPAVQKARAMMDDDELGDIISIKLALRRDSALTRKHVTWRDSSLSNMTSGAMGDLGVHLIDLAHYLSRSEINADSVRALCKTNVRNKENGVVEVDDYSFFGAQLSNGTFVEISSSKTALPEEIGLFVEIIGSRQTFYFHSGFRDFFQLRKGVYWNDVPLPCNAVLPDPVREVPGWADTFLNQMTSFLQRRQSPIADFADGLKAQKVLTRVIEQGRSALLESQACAGLEERAPTQALASLAER